MELKIQSNANSQIILSSSNLVVTCTVINNTRYLNVREQVEVVEKNKIRSPTFLSYPLIRQCL